MSEIPNVTPGSTIATAWGNEVKDRTIMRYANAAARDASIPVPVNGDVAYLVDPGVITYFFQLVWETLVPDSQLQAELGAYSRIRVHSDIDNVNTGASGEFGIPTGFQPTAHVCYSAQPAAPAVITVQSVNSTEIIWMAVNAVTGSPLSNTAIDVTYTIWGV